METSTAFLSYVLALTALASILCLRINDAKEFLVIIVTLAVGIGFITVESEVASSALLALALVIFLVVVVLYKDLSTTKNFYWGVGTLSLAIASTILYMLTKNPALLLLTFMIMVPLFPLHGGYLSLISGLPLAVAAFFSMLLPVMGLYGIFNLPGTEPSVTVPKLLVVLSVAGAFYGSLRALVQKRGPDFVAYAGLALFSVLWLAVGLGALAAPSAFAYASSLGAVTAGLLLVWRCITVRYGDVRIDTLIKRVGGLSKPMPVFGTLFFFIIVAAVGLPPFGLFMGFVEVLIGMSAKLSWLLFVVLATWLMASWYFIVFMQKALFAPKKLSFKYTRLGYSEGLSLGIILIILLVLGVGSYKNLGLGVASPTHDQEPQTEVASWQE